MSETKKTMGQVIAEKGLEAMLDADRGSKLIDPRKKKAAEVPEKKPDAVGEARSSHEPSPIADQVVARFAEREAELERQKGKESKQAWDFYVETLLSEAEPSEATIASLVEVCGELGIDSDRVRRDKAIIARAKFLQGEFDRLEEYNKKAIAGRVAFKEIECENKARLEKARKEWSFWEGKRSFAREARDDLRFSVARQSPKLFNLTLDPPRLKTFS